MRTHAVRDAGRILPRHERAERVRGGKLHIIRGNFPLRRAVREQLAAKSAFVIFHMPVRSTRRRGGGDKAKIVRSVLRRDYKRRILHRGRFVLRVEVRSALRAAVVRTHAVRDTGCRNPVRPLQCVRVRRRHSPDPAYLKPKCVPGHFRDRYADLIGDIYALARRDRSIGLRRIYAARHNDIFVRAVQIRREPYPAFCKIADKPALQRLPPDKLARGARVKLLRFRIVFVCASLEAAVFEIQRLPELRKLKLVSHRPRRVRRGHIKRIRAVARKGDDLVPRKESEGFALLHRNELHGGRKGLAHRRHEVYLARRIRAVQVLQTEHMERLVAYLAERHDRQTVRAPVQRGSPVCGRVRQRKLNVCVALQSAVRRRNGDERIVKLIIPKRRAPADADVLRSRRVYHGYAVDLPVAVFVKLPDIIRPSVYIGRHVPGGDRRAEGIRPILTKLRRPQTFIPRAVSVGV